MNCRANNWGQIGLAVYLMDTIKQKDKQSINIKIEKCTTRSDGRIYGNVNLVICGLLNVK